MLKVFIYPQWRYDLLEQFLEKMELSGYRVSSVSFFYLFRFQSAPPREVRYLYSYAFFRETELLGLEHKMRKNHHANEVESSFFFPTTILRITDVKTPFHEFTERRQKYIQHVLVQKLLLVLLLGVGVLGCLLKHVGSASLFMTCIWSVFVVYYLVGISFIRRKSKT